VSNHPNGNHQNGGQLVSKGQIKVVHIYPREMSIYGDLGNTRAWRAG